MAWLLLCLLLAGPSPQVHIVEVLADVLGPEGDGGGEWVELHNTGDTPVDLTGWSLGDEADPGDLLRPWAPGGGAVLAPGGRALLLDPDSDPELIGPPVGTLLLRPDDASIGNGLRGDADRLRLRDALGTVIDSMGWSTPAGEGVSWERVGGAAAAAGAWRISRAPAGSTPGAPNSWTPLPGDRSVRLEGQPPARAGQTTTLSARVREEGGALQTDLVVGLETTGPMGGTLCFAERVVPALAPFDSVTVVWSWVPDTGGVWTCSVCLDGGTPGRGWWDRDRIELSIPAAPRERIVSEAMPVPLPGGVEWLELAVTAAGDPAPVLRDRDWSDWTVEVATLDGAGRRRLVLPPLTAPGVLLHAGKDPPVTGPVPFRVQPWSGLRLADRGSRVLLRDPSGTVVDSVLLRSLDGLPRGLARQRWYPDLAGWLPWAWGVGATPEAATPGYPGPAAVEHGEPPGDLVFRVSHPAPGEVVLDWAAPAARLWLEVRLFDLAGRPAGTPIPERLVAGRASWCWCPLTQDPRLQPGHYLLVVTAQDADSPARWRRRLPLGVRP